MHMGTPRLHTLSALVISLSGISCPSFAAPDQALGPVLERIKETGHIRLGVRDASVPFSYALKTGQAGQTGQTPIGYSIDLCHKTVEAIRLRTGLKKIEIDYVFVTAATRIDSVLQGKVDLNCESTTNNAERRQKVAFSIPHYITGSRYLVRSNSGLQSLHDFEGKTLVSTAGSAPLKAISNTIQERALKIKLVEASDHPSAFEMVEKGEADGYVMAEILLVAQTAARPQPENLAIVGKYLTIDAMGFMMDKNDPELKLLVDTELRRLIKSREAHTIHDRWFLQPIAPNGKSLNVQMSYMLKDFWKYPSDWVPN
jgi:ABC-type amino acid transport substrate-binding protein